MKGILYYLIDMELASVQWILMESFGLAFLILSANKLYLARDPFGVKPLY